MPLEMPLMRFEIEGPFELGRTSAGIIDSSAVARREDWDWVEEFVPRLPDACGCYIFSIKASRGSLPWYIGKAERQSFRKECLTPHKIVHFNNVIVIYAHHVETDILEDTGGGGHYSIQVQLWGEGPVRIFRDGQMFDGKWVRPDRWDLMRFVDGNGNPLPLKPGNTFIQMVPLGFEVDIN